MSLPARRRHAEPNTRAMDAAEAARNRMVMLSPSRADYNETRVSIGAPAGRQPTFLSDAEIRDPA